MKRTDYEKIFADYLGIRNVIWLGSGIAGDDTHGHVDDITRFVAPDTVVTAVESESRRSQLRAAAGKHPTPAGGHRSGWKASGDHRTAHARAGDLRRAASARQLWQFLHRQWLVLVPVFNDPNDRFALDILADLFPDREVVGIYSGDLIWGIRTRCTA